MIELFKKKKESLVFRGFLQALGTAAYCALVGIVLWKGNKWFGKVPNFWGPLLFLSLFVTSALICALLTLGYPVFLFWEKKQRLEALRLVAYTTGWLVLFVLLVILILVVF